MAQKMRWREEEDEEEQGIDCVNEADPKSLLLFPFLFNTNFLYKIT